MKQLKNDVTEIPARQVFVKRNEGKKIDDITGTADYCDLIEHCVHTPPKEGFNYHHIDRRSRLMKVVDKCRENDGSLMKFEDEDAKYLKEMVHSAKWGTFHPDLKAFMDKVEGMKV